MLYKLIVINYDQVMEYFDNKQFEKEFIHNIPNAESLIRKELILLKTEEDLLEQRIRLMKNFANELPSWDPQYGMIRLALEMDQFDLSEHHLQRDSLVQKLNDLHKSGDV
jgi:hypothetical protein